MTCVGVLADTHIPDRSPRLALEIIHIFQQAKVKLILHVGDVIVPRVLTELEQVAPIYAVKGNRDIFYLRHLPLKVELNIDGYKLGMAHGHHSFTHYMGDKLYALVNGLRTEGYYIRRMLHMFPGADVIVFGHLHSAVNLHMEGKLLFNPGSTSFPRVKGDLTSVGLLHFSETEPPRGEIIPLGQSR